jgi:two-component system nitrogen regulation response regulator NtrX
MTLRHVGVIARTWVQRGDQNRGRMNLPQPSVDVLIVDDDDAIRSTWAEILHDAGYSVAVAEDGDIALDLLEHESAGMVLLDLRMPRRDGLSVLEVLTAQQPVVLASGHAIDEVTLARVGAKVVTYLEKPVQPERLLAVVATTLEGSRVDGN